MNAIETRGLTRRFGARTAVDHLDLSIGKGEFFALLGGNGAGKSTTVRMLCGLLPPSEGDAFLLGESIAQNSGRVKTKLNSSPQETAVAPKLSVRENLEMMARIYGASREEAKEKARSMMADFGLTEREKDRAGKLSGGLQRRLSIAMALISKPEILFLDEPGLGVDVRARRELWRILENLKGKMAILLTTHYMDEAEALADRVGILHEGRLRALGTAEELKRETGTATLEDAFLALTDGEIE